MAAALSHSRHKKWLFRSAKSNGPPVKKRNAKGEKAINELCTPQNQKTYPIIAASNFF